jgi:glycerophosphodiester phosphodiesterase
VLGRANLQTSRPKANPGERRSQSLTRKQERGIEEVQDRMKYTVDFTKKGFKPNTRGSFIQDSFATLEELLVELPKSIGFDIEISTLRQTLKWRKWV